MAFGAGLVDFTQSVPFANYQKYCRANAYLLRVLSILAFAKLMPIGSGLVVMALLMTLIEL